MTTTIQGLLTQKNDTPAPQPGDIKPYVVSQLTSKSGKPWTKIKFDSQQGQPFKVLSVQGTDYADQYGNVSFNIEIEPAQSNAPATTRNGVPSVPRGTVADTWRQHLMRAANLLSKCHEAAKAVGLTDGEDARSLFIDASRAGFIPQMPAKPFADESEPESMMELSDDEPRPEDTQEEF